jgi:alpha-ribazole phosphatase
MDVYLIRHTRPRIESGLCYGQLEVPLAPTCAEDCAAVAARLPSVEAVWTSPLARCRTLAETIGTRVGVAPVVDGRLRELGFGQWEGRRWETIAGGEMESWGADYWNVAPPGGEAYRELYERVGQVLAEIFACDARRVAVVTHAGPIRAALVQCLRLDPRRYPQVALDYGGINLFHVGVADDAAWSLEYLNG